MNGLERVRCALRGEAADRPPLLPILHSGLPGLFGVSQGAYFAAAPTMAEVIDRGYRAFGYDGVQLSLGVTGEAEALGALVEQPEDAGPVLRSSILPDLTRVDDLRSRDPTVGGRMPLYFEAVRRTVDDIGAEAFVLAILRGPLLMASQLCGVESCLIALLEQPEAMARVLDFTSAVVVRLGAWLRASGAHGLMLGEATCSPNFISPRLYRRMILPRHREVVAALRQVGWSTLGLHICGDTRPILKDLITTGVDLLDIDYQVPAREASEITEGQVALRGNLDPSRVFRFGSVQDVRDATSALRRTVAGDPRWILSSGCDIPPGTPAEALAAFVETAQRRTP